MTMKMLIDATHEEETRVAIVDGNRVEEFDYESSQKKQIKGNIYLAKITRVEPSLQAAFVEYGGNRQGFLAFSEIHPDYYQIPVSDRERLIAEEAAAYAAILAAEEAAEEAVTAQDETMPSSDKPKRSSKEDMSKEDTDDAVDVSADNSSVSISENNDKSDNDSRPTTKAEMATKPESIIEQIPSTDIPDKNSKKNDALADGETENGETDGNGTTITDDEDAEEKLRIKVAKGLRHKYKIQEVIKKNQIVLIQVVKEERGNKGAALTTYLSLPGRYCVLMPNTLHGGGVSRKIASMGDRKTLKKILSDLKMPSGIGCIIRTAGKSRTKTEIKRDFDYLIRTWEGIKERTLKSTAPILINEEGDLIKRSIRDLYTRDIDEILVEGEEGYKTARGFMRLLMPSHARKVKQYTDPIPLLQKYQVESQLDSMFSPIVQLKSGGYIVINPTEALVSIDVNSGKATKEYDIEETARKTNLEAAEEVARQLRLRDMAGLIVIDFIDMEVRGNNRAVEQKLKDCLISDRARIQVGKISSFGLLEMSRQRLRSGMLESSTRVCPHCEGSGVIRSIETQILHILRELEEEGIKARNKKITVYLPEQMAIYLLNNKRSKLVSMEQQYDYSISIVIDKTLTESSYKIELALAGKINEKQVATRPANSGSSEQSAVTAQPRHDRGQTTNARRNRQRNQNRQDRARTPDTPVSNTAAQEGESSETPAIIGAEGQNVTVLESQENKSRRRRRRPRRNNKIISEDAVFDATKEPAALNNTSEAPQNPTETTSADSGQQENSNPLSETNIVTNPVSNNEEIKRPRRKRVRTVRKKHEAEKETETDMVSQDAKNSSDVEKNNTDTSAVNVTEAKRKAKPARRPYPPQTRARRTAIENKPTDDAVKQPASVTPEPSRDMPEPKVTTENKTPPTHPKPNENKAAEFAPSSPKRTGWWQRTFG